MDRGTVVEFSVKGTPRLAVVEALEGKSSFKVTDTFGNSLVVAPRDVEFRSHDYRLSDRTPVSASSLQGWKDRAAAARADVDLATAWELYASGPALSLEGLAECFWDELTGERAYALFSALREDKQYFKAKADRYEPRTAAQVEELRKQNEAVAAKEKLQGELLGRLKARFADANASLGPEDLRRLESVKRYSLWGEEAADRNAGLELLKWLDRPQTEASAFQLLVEARVWSRHENLDALRAGLSVTFEESLETEAAAVAVRRHDPARVLDLTALASVTVDDETTTEVDDALAVEALPDGRTRYWVHIADPGRWIEPGSPLDLEARRRGTTVYLPTGRYTMFPPTLAEGPFSLNAGVDTPALSFGCVLAEDGALSEYTVSASTIRVARRLSYHDAESLRDDPVIAALARTADLREQWRRSQGAVMIQLPETEVKVDLATDNVQIGVYSADAAREWVAEFMILAGEAAARFALEKNLPMLFRVQKPGDPVEVGHLPAGPVREFAKIVSMTRSTLGVEPGPHAGLGLSSYVQATSPIRRYGDLAVHRQLKAAAAGETPPYTVEELATLAAELDPLNAQAAKMERNADRYWVTELLSRRKGQTWSVLFLGWFREDDKLAQVLIEELGYRVTMKLPKAKPLGERFSVKAAAADARKELLNLVEA